MRRFKGQGYFFLSTFPPLVLTPQQISQPCLVMAIHVGMAKGMDFAFIQLNNYPIFDIGRVALDF